MRKIIAIVFVLNILINFIFTEVNADSDKGYFVVTAYYSPLPDQEKYLTGDYESEKRLNGQGIRGASGKEVFSGMLAAPKNYKFGLKIYLEGLGVGEVSDRGGAIVNAGNRGYSYDRIDVWVGYGDEGLRRALYWGKRTIKGNFVSSDSKITLDYYNLPAPMWATKGLEKIPKKIKLEKKDLSVFNSSANNLEKIKKLQIILRELGLYEGEINGEYKTIIDPIYDYQLLEGIVTSIYSPGAGNFGPKTRLALKETYTKYNEELVRRKEEEEKKLEEIRQEELRKKELEEKYKALENLSQKKAEEKISFIGTPKFGEISHSVRELQKTLKQFGYFEAKDTAIYGKLTKQSIIAYQIDKKIIKSETDAGAGVIGPKTTKALKNDLQKEFLKEIIASEKKSENELVLIVKDKI